VVPAEQPNPLLLRRYPPVVLRLVLNVPPDGGDLRGTGRKRRITIRPIEPGRVRREGFFPKIRSEFLRAPVQGRAVFFQFRFPGAAPHSRGCAWLLSLQLDGLAEDPASRHGNRSKRSYPLVPAPPDWDDEHDSIRFTYSPILPINRFPHPPTHRFTQ